MYECMYHMDSPKKLFNINALDDYNDDIFHED